MFLPFLSNEIPYFKLNFYFRKLLKNYIMDVEDLCKKHYECLKSYESYKNVSECILNDMLMNRVRKENGVIRVVLNNITINLIKEWYKLSEIVKYYNTFLTVYRGVYNIDKMQSVIIQPIPFSTCVEYSFAKDWINDCNFSYVMKINIPPFTPYTFNNNINEGNEVILPAGFLSKKSENQHFVEYNFMSLNYKEMNILLQNSDVISLTESK